MSAVLAEVAEVLARYGRMRCVPTVERSGDHVALTVVVEGDGDLTLLALHDDLLYVADIATLRALCAKYGIATESLEDYVNKQKE